MATPLTGREIVIGAKKASAWGTAVACGEGDGVLLTAFAPKETIDNLKDKSFGIANIKTSDQGKIEVPAFTVTGYLRYEGLDLLMALAMGSAPAPVICGATAAYAYKLKLAGNNVGLFCTMSALKKSDVVAEYPSVKIFGFKITGKMNEAAEITFNCQGNYEELESVINTIVTMADITYPDTGNRLILSRNQTFYCRINDADGAALDSGDDMGISDFTLTFARKNETIFDFKHTGTGEPSENDFSDFTLELNWPRYDDESHPLFLDAKDGTPKKIELCFTGAEIESPYNYLFKILCPNALPIDPDSTPTGPGRIPAKVTFDLRGCDAAPTGMTDVTEPFEIQGVNTRTISALATTDVFAPTISIHLPTNAATFSTANATIDVAGICHDNVAVTSVTYAVTGDGSGSGSAVLSPDGSEWLIEDLALTVGDNIVTVTAHDAAALTAADVITITRTA